MTTELERLQGAWRIASLEMNGEDQPAAAFADATITLTGNRFVSHVSDADYNGILEIHATTKPKGFDLLFTSGPQDGTRHLGIYKLDDDEWTICFAMTGDVRPKRFMTKPDSG